MRRWRRARWLHMKAAQGKNTVNEMVEHFTGWILEAGGPLGRVLSRGLACARRRHACEATDAVFPLPMLPPSGHPKVFCAKGLASAGRAWVNVIIAALNLLHAGSEEGAVCSSSPTAAHSRIHEQLCESVSGFLGELSDWPSDTEIREFLRLSEGHLPSSGAALPLGELGGVPPSAAEVSVSEVLRKSHPELARQAEEPTSLLFPPPLRPESVRKPHALLHKTYAKYVLRNVQVGLQRLAPVRSVFKHRGRPLVGGFRLVQVSY